jgi:hypothetical protein
MSRGNGALGQVSEDEAVTLERGGGGYLRGVVALLGGRFKNGGGADASITYAEPHAPVSFSRRTPFSSLK